MATTVGVISYDVRLNLAQLKGDVKQAEKVVNSSNNNIEKSSENTGSAVSGMFATIGKAAKVAGVAAVAAFGSFSVNQCSINLVKLLLGTGVSRLRWG